MESHIGCEGSHIEHLGDHMLRLMALVILRLVCQVDLLCYRRFLAERSLGEVLFFGFCLE